MSMTHAFLLMVYLGKQVTSQDMYFRNIDNCLYYAQRLTKQPSVPNRIADDDAPKRLSYTAVFVPKRIGSNQKVY